MKDTKIPLD